jgi:Protein of unknown function (DUF3307)
VPSSVVTLLIVLLMLEVKHFLFDYPLQTHFQLRNKATYGHVGGLLHAGLHVLGTSTVFLIARPSLPVGAAILLGEFIVHYHLDWAKGQLNKRSGLTTTDALYWWGIGVDQMLHHLTYLAIAAILYATGAMG